MTDGDWKWEDERDLGLAADERTGETAPARGPAPGRGRTLLERQLGIRGATATVRRAKLMRRLQGPAPAIPESASALIDDATREAGPALPDETARVAAQLGLGDLSGVRLHDGPASARATSALGARAFATGDDIVFAPGSWNPDSPDGQQLLGHELAHTVQQRGAGAVQPKLEVSEPGDTCEVEADRYADAHRQAWSGDLAGAVEAAPVLRAGSAASVARETDPAAGDAAAPKAGGAGAVGRFRWRDAPPAPMALVSDDLAVADVPALLRAAPAFRDVELLSVGLYFADGSLTVFVSAFGSEGGYAASVDAAALARQLASLGQGVAAYVKRQLAGVSGSSALGSLAGGRFTLWLSGPDRQPRNFAVFDLARVIAGLAAGSNAGFRPVEARVELGGVGGVSLYRGDALNKSQAFAGKGSKLPGSYKLENKAVRSKLFGDDEEAVWVSVYRGDGTITIGFGADENADKGIAATVDVESLIDKAVRALGALGSLAGSALARIKEAVKTLGSKLLAWANGLLRLNLSSDGSSFFEFDLGLRLPGLALGNFDWGSLIPDRFRLGGGGGSLSLLPDLSWPGPVLGSFPFPRDALARLAGYLRRLIPSWDGSPLPGFMLPEVKLWSIDPASWLLGLSIDLGSLFPSGSGRKLGISISLRGLLDRLGSGASALLGKIKALLAKGATAIKDRVSVDSSGILRVLLDETPDKAGNRVGFDLTKFFNGFSADDLVPVELHLQEGGGVLSYGTAADSPGDGPAVLVAAPGGTPAVQTTINAPGVLKRHFGKDARTIAIQVFTPGDQIIVFGALRPGDRGLLLSYDIGHWRTRIGSRLFAMSPGSATGLAVKATARGVWIGVGVPTKPSGSYAIYRYETLAGLMTGKADLTALVPDEFKLQRDQGAIAIAGTNATRTELPAGGLKKQIGSLPGELKAVFGALSFADDQLLHVDTAASKVADADGDKMVLSLSGGVYSKTDAGYEGTTLRLDVDLIAVLRAFLPEALLAKIFAGNKRKGPKNAGASFDPKTSELTLSYKHQKSKKGTTRELELQAGWTLKQLIDIALSLDTIAADPGALAPTSFTGSFANDRWKLTVSARDGSGDAQGHAFPLATTPGLAELSAQFLSPEMRGSATLYLNVDLEKLAKDAAAAIAKWEPLKVASAAITLGQAPSVRTFGVGVTIQPGMLLKLLEMFPAGWVTKVGKLVYQLARDPDAAMDNVFYTAVGSVEAVKALASHDVDTGDLSAGDWARLAVAAFDGDMKELIAMSRVTRRLIRLGVLDPKQLKSAKKNFQAYLGRDREAVLEYVKQVDGMSDRELQKSAEVRKAYKNHKELKRFLGWYESLPAGLRREVATLDKLADKYGINIDLSGLQMKFDPSAAANRLARIHELYKRFRAGASAAAVVAELEGKGASPDEAHKAGRKTFDQRIGGGGAGGNPVPEVERRKRYDRLSKPQLASLLKDGAVVVAGSGGKQEVVSLHAGDDGYVARLLGDQINVFLAEGKAPGGDGDGSGDGSGDGAGDDRDGAGGGGASGSQDAEAVLDVYQGRQDAATAAALAARSRLSKKQLEKARRLNPGLMRKHGLTPADFDTSATIDSFAFAVYVADWQYMVRLSVDGIVGTRTAAKVKAMRKKGDSGGSAGAGAEAKSKPGTGGSAGADAVAPSGTFKMAISDRLAQQAVRYDSDKKRLVLSDWAAGYRWVNHVATEKAGLRPMVSVPTVRQETVSGGGPDLVLKYWVSWNLNYVATMGEMRSQMVADRVERGPYLHTPGASNHTWVIRKQSYGQELVRQKAVDIVGHTVLKERVTVHGASGPMIWEIADYRLIKNETSAKDGTTWVYFVVNIYPLDLGGPAERPIRDAVTGAFRVLRVKKPTRAFGFKVQSG